jgi:hypothetical protein
MRRRSLVANEESASDRCSAFACDGQPDAGAPDPVLCELVGDVAEDGQPGLVVDSPVAAGADDDGVCVLGDIHADMTIKERALARS